LIEIAIEPEHSRIEHSGGSCGLPKRTNRLIMELSNISDNLDAEIDHTTVTIGVKRYSVDEEKCGVLLSHIAISFV